jgi:phenylalanyl-tRNA synthetase beta chain
MPKIVVSKKELEKLIGKSIDLELLGETLISYLKAEIEKAEGDELTIKLEDTNRPDLWSAEGLSRVLRNLLGKEKGFPSYESTKSDFVVNVEEAKLKNIRPFIACAIIKSIKLDDEGIKSLMQIQDKLDTTYGRKRKRTSIGVYDLGKIKPPVVYTTAGPDDVKFIPLGFNVEMTPREILETHPKGIEYRHILEGFDEYPILIDSENNILSFPPIINSEHLGKVTRDTRDVLVEVTGTDELAVNAVLNLVATALVERGGKLESVKIKYKQRKKEEVTPVLEPTVFDIKPSFIKKLTGLNLDMRQLKHVLEKMGYEVYKIDENRDSIEIEAPFYRTDIMHPVDIVEDIAIGYGYNNIEPFLPKTPTIGGLKESTIKEDLIREIMIGIGQQELSSFTFTNKDVLFKNMNQKEEDVVEIANPVTMNYTVLRSSLLPVLMNFLAINKTVEFPQNIFEVGDVITLNKKSENGTDQKKHLCSVISSSSVTFTEMKSVLESLMKNINREVTIEPTKNPSFIDGRCGEIILNKKSIGIIGEIHPQVIENFGLENPVAAFEICVDLI